MDSDSNVTNKNLPFAVNKSNKMEQLRFLFFALANSTCFGWQSHPSSGVHVELASAKNKKHNCCILLELFTTIKHDARNHKY